MIIGVVGFINSGKGTVADLLVSEHSFRKMSFADPLKDAAADIFGWSRASLEGDTEASRKFREMPDKYWSDKLGREMTPRLALQLMGTECFREHFDPSIWVFALEKRIATTIVDPLTQNIVIPDTRFPNEVKFIQDNGGRVIRVKRGDDPEWFDDACDDDAKNLMHKYHPSVHYSEWAWCGSTFDAIIYNDGSLDDLKQETKNTLKNILTSGTI